MFRVNDSRGAIPFTRVGSTTREMTPHQIQQAVRQRRQEPDDASLTFDASQLRRKAPQAADWRITDSRVEWAFAPRDVVFGSMVPFYPSAPWLQTLRKDLWLTSLADVTKVFNAAEKHLFLDVDARLSYAIEQDGHVRNGWGLQNLLADLQDLKRVVEELLKLKGNRNAQDWYYAPSITAYGSALGGVFWFALQSRDHMTFRSGECGLILDQPYFDDAPARAFFREVGGAPLMYQPTRGPQYIRIVWHGPLRNPVPLHVDEADEHAWRILVDNPLHGRAAELNAKHKVPELIATALAAIPRLPLEVRGGLLPKSDKKFAHTEIEILSNYAGPGLYVGGICSAISPKAKGKAIGGIRLQPWLAEDDSQ